MCVPCSCSVRTVLYSLTTKTVNWYVVPRIRYEYHTWYTSISTRLYKYVPGTKVPTQFWLFILVSINHGYLTRTRCTTTSRGSVDFQSVTNFLNVALVYDLLVLLLLLILLLLLFLLLGYRVELYTLAVRPLLCWRGRFLGLVLTKKRKWIPIQLFRLDCTEFVSGQKMNNQQWILIVGQEKFDSIMLAKNSKTSSRLDWIEFDELIQLDKTQTRWANVIRRLFALCRRP